MSAVVDSQLKRVIGLPLITLYGIGTIVGAGIYVLVGKVVASSGFHAPISFLIAALVAAFTALSYAELAGRFPRSAGVAHYVNQAFARVWLARLMGLAVVATGVVSAATMTRGFVGYFQYFLMLPTEFLIVAFVALMTGLAIWGVAESLRVAALITLVEVMGILLMLVATQSHWTRVPEDWQTFLPAFSAEHWTHIGLGAFLAFFAFIGFEDMVNMAEEVKDARRTLPRAIVIAISVTACLYMLVVWAAVNALPLAQLSSSTAPFADLVAESRWLPVWAITLISLLAISNGALIQVIMASRVFYGMSDQGLLPGWLRQVNRVTRTPVNATLVAGAAVLLFASLLPLEALARVTSFIILCVFCLVNLALLKIKRAEKQQPEDDAGASIRYPLAVPVLGLLSAGALLAVQIVKG